MATLAELRAAVRRQTETTGAELPNATVDGHLRQAFERTINVEDKWPFYETTWTFEPQPGETSITLPQNLNRTSIESVILQESPPDGTWRRLQKVDSSQAEGMYLEWSTLVSQWVEFSLWSRMLSFWPSTPYPAPVAVRVRGYRMPNDWISGGESAVVDADERLHRPLVNYAVALAYAQQEDMELERSYMERWQRDVEIARNQIMEPVHDLPLRMGGGLREYRRIFR